jgi:hypothetical protein
MWRNGRTFPRDVTVADAVAMRKQRVEESAAPGGRPSARWRRPPCWTPSRMAQQVGGPGPGPCCQWPIDAQARLSSLAGPTSAKWGVHIRHIEIMIAYCAYCAYYFAYFAYWSHQAMHLL